jgi:phosphoribosylamine--glycine ligase
MVMRVVVVGSGGREHVLADVLRRTADVVVTPGNAGIPGSTNAAPEDLDADLFVIGPEAPLVDGLADRLRARGKLVFGPGADGARLEGSKAWMKEMLAEAAIPTARFGAFTELEPALAFLRTLPGLYVIKTDGLAAGKGVFVTESLAEASEDVRAKLSGRSFGEAGKRIVIEEGLSGPELSVLMICSGHFGLQLQPAQDFKRASDGDAGPNTGGMGAYSPVPFFAEADAVGETVVEPILRALDERGIDYRGVLYAGLMLTPEGIKVLEFNVRFGDPEAQVVLPRLSCDLAAMLSDAAAGKMEATPEFVPDAAVTVVLASEGYPTSTRTGDVIRGIDEANALDGVTVYSAGVGPGPMPGTLVTAGGRVLNVTAIAPTIAAARDRAYEAVKRISWPGVQFRTDIALEAAKDES